MLVLWLPIMISTIAMFVFSYLAWEVLGLHDKDWRQIENEDKLMQCIREMDIPDGNYQLPGGDSAKEMRTEEFQAKFKAGPRAIITLMPEPNMAKNLGLTLLYHLFCCATFAYLANFALKPGTDPGADFITVFRFVATISLLTFGAATVLQAIWFGTRVDGHVIEAIIKCLIVGLIFASMWP